MHHLSRSRSSADKHRPVCLRKLPAIAEFRSLKHAHFAPCNHILDTDTLARSLPAETPRTCLGTRMQPSGGHGRHVCKHTPHRGWQNCPSMQIDAYYTRRRSIGPNWRDSKTRETTDRLQIVCEHPEHGLRNAVLSGRRSDEDTNAISSIGGIRSRAHFTSSARSASLLLSAVHTA